MIKVETLDIPSTSNQASAEMPTTVEPPKSVVASSNLSNWDINFKVEWTSMPHDLQQAVVTKSRPSTKSREHMVRIIVDKMRKHCLNPTLSQTLLIAKPIVRECPE